MTSPLASFITFHTDGTRLHGAPEGQGAALAGGPAPDAGAWGDRSLTLAAPLRNAFTLLELLVVVTIIVVLLALLAPALDRAIESAQRVKCAANLHVIQVGDAQYAVANRRRLLECRLLTVNHAFDARGTNDGDPNDSQILAHEQVDWPAAMASVGLASRDKVLVNSNSTNSEPGGHVDNQPGPMWDCPGRSPWKSRWATGLNPPVNGYGRPSNGWTAMLIGYHYYGGTRTWYSPYRPAPIPARSPAKLSDPGGWALASDVVAYVNNTWDAGPQNMDYWDGLQAHRDDDSLRPAGSNHVFMDGSAQWIEADRLLMIHSWNGGANELYFYWQNDLGNWQPAENDLGRLSARK